MPFLDTSLIIIKKIIRVFDQSLPRNILTILS